MKKALLVILALVVVFVLGFVLGAKDVLFNSYKWVEEDKGVYLIVTEYHDQQYIDVADKGSHNYNYFSFVLERR